MKREVLWRERSSVDVLGVIERVEGLLYTFVSAKSVSFVRMHSRGAWMSIDVRLMLFPTIYLPRASVVVLHLFPAENTTFFPLSLSFLLILRQSFPPLLNDLFHLSHAALVNSFQFLFRLP